eukprot:CAMPEP_0180218346 /NCGR_PEP_ID=MMETSP0987-20121128/17619_1 /TAXON_ID=697907 /ORGANISM="non described non described, Strain CCMP2293" /LENGTH=97 /DNA_ID=CAMNT_0022178343 /DNA_START=439 /DNA_END=728 /DNA_ORIENTATION=+
MLRPSILVSKVKCRESTGTSRLLHHYNHPSPGRKGEWPRAIPLAVVTVQADPPTPEFHRLSKTPNKKAQAAHPANDHPLTASFITRRSLQSRSAATA